MVELKIGTRVKERYTLKEFKGSGSFGEVWLAHDEVLDSDIAIKIYVSLDPRGVEEFKSEYITTQGISHPNLLTTTYFDVWEQRPFLVMKYCSKGSSSSLVGKIEEYALWQFIHDVAAGLKYLHNMPEPIIHQDIKPDNILVDDSYRYLITDFGISKKVRSTMRKQSKRAVGAGATAYMGPERFDSEPTPVKASDIWSLGASIYELATGELPFSGLGGGMQRNGAEIPSLDNKWSKEMNMVMQSCLAKETWDRPTAQQLAEFSNAILNGETAQATWGVTPIKENNDESTNLDSQTEVISETYKKSVGKGKRNSFIFILIASVLVLFSLVWFSVTKNENNVNQVESEKNETNIESSSIENQQNIKSGVKETTPPKVQSAHSSVRTNKEEEEISIKEIQDDDNATILKRALTNKDYQVVQKLANQGYPAAYGPLAKYYLSNHDYTAAETYAKKAKAAGYKEGTTVLNTLENLGYYD